MKTNAFLENNFDNEALKIISNKHYVKEPQNSIVLRITSQKMLNQLIHIKIAFYTNHGITES